VIDSAILERQMTSEIDAINHGRSRLPLRLLVRGIGGLALINGLLFGLADRLDWRAAWVLSALLAVYLGAGVTWFLHKDPGLLRERITRAANVPTWDRVIVPLHQLSVAGLLAVAALDAGRARWSHVPVSVQFAGGLGMLASFAVIWWCTSANHFLSSQSRIQSERGHQVVREGPYRFVRHPMYTSLIVLMVSMALLLGSWLALAPALLIAVLLTVRTVFEDRMLTAQLPGYRDYASSVTRRLVPGIW
jgi:protein-S-isoprenylcysteine O-methyltransferase Ste14